jgi:hypothetical protein
LKHSPMLHQFDSTFLQVGRRRSSTKQIQMAMESKWPRSTGCTSLILNRGNPGRESNKLWSSSLFNTLLPSNFKRMKKLLANWFKNHLNIIHSFWKMASICKLFRWRKIRFWCE